MLLVGGTVVVFKAAFSPAATDGHTPAPAEASELQAAIDASAKYMAERKYPEARALLERMAEKHPTDRQVRILLARALVAQQEFAGAYEQFVAAMALADGDAALHFEAGTVANAAGLVDRAYEHYYRAQAMAPKDPKYPLYLAMIQIKRDERNAAKASLVRAVTLDETIAEAWGTLGELELEDGSLGLAQQHVEKARGLQPESEKWKIDEAKILNRNNEPEKAATLLLSLSKETRHTKPVLSLLGQCYGLLGKPEDAAAMYEEAFLQKRDAELAYEAALWRQRAGDEAGMRKMAEAAERLGHPDAGALLK